ncbi:putative selection and upkeep of intraepithelial T-cells protein 1 homolog isoform X2 [Xenopus laevis]|uniref:Selection and upkeep of intraepithelial T-cells protein 1 homolog isoform X2 n=1 Tax=Xenopus laevis TaxID=8355 RepID=A0A8J0TNI3_XENLA|nr:putative selection and upkeep of intraepithelial T-cells protein 1 homolog isoform X2 [Xenopus laevis]
MGPIMRIITIGLSIFSTLYKESLSVRFKVTSVTSVVATLGSDVVLPCRLTPEMNAEKMEIRWFKPMYQPYVHLYINGKDDYSIQMPQFTNRTELIKENITRGVFPLKIHKVTAQDSGEYYCFVESSDHHGRTIVQLNVTAVGTRPNISKINNDTLLCESCDWLPKPHLTWTDNEGKQIIPSMERLYRDEKSLYCITSIINLPSTSNITCTVSNSLNQNNEFSMQIREKGQPQTCRDLYSRYILFWSCLAVTLGCICLLLKSHRELQKVYDAFRGLLRNQCHNIWTEKVNGNLCAELPVPIIQSDGVGSNSASLNTPISNGKITHV